MKKKIVHLLKVFFIVFYIFSFSACNLNPKFELTAKTETSTIISGNSFCVQVYTKNIGQSYKYRGSSTKIGAMAVIYMETTQGKVYLEHEPISMTDDITNVTIETDEIISHKWIFFTDANTLKGTYALSLTYVDNELIIPNFVTII